MVPKGIDKIPQKEKRLLIELATIANASQDRLSTQRLADLIRIRARASSRNAWDHNNRVLIGARVPRERAEIYRDAAARTDRSLYRFVLDALDHEAASAAACRSPGSVPGEQNGCFVDQEHDVQTI